jgi:hypothetical protein
VVDRPRPAWKIWRRANIPCSCCSATMITRRTILRFTPGR